MNTFEKLRAIIVDVLEIDAGLVTQESTPKDLDADSIDLIDIAGETEQTFKVEIPDDALAGFETVGDFVEYIETHL